MRFITLNRSSLSYFTKRYYSDYISNIMIHDIRAPTSGKVRVISLNRPAKRNAISRQLLKELREAIDQIHTEYSDYEKNQQFTSRKKIIQSQPTTRVVILTSSIESCFCAGADLIERESFTAKETTCFLADLRSTFSSLSDLPIPSISAISSVALGGGLELALCTDLRVFTNTAIVGLPETRLGIIPGAGGTYRLPALIGKSRAKDLILTGRRVSGKEAHFLGIADRLVEILPKENESNIQLRTRALQEVQEAAINLAFEICEGGPLAIVSALKAVKSEDENIENQMYERVVCSHDRNEALVAFKEKRKPNFTGR
ncbi:putative enoyl-CoA hydratase 2, mitochondrial [Erysiphe neolycopersici]|uniref:Putative enoyl-CoA hydratase 2, mitochondrial n=1 Tax=Erysiphe neolycopersici TaxID=212602 RepID=A0A420HXG2_9PEZI|nr:putative enoyl-CoA hydratase 2, mitochondrial [Erysiphe neolycopersici]